MLHRPGSASSRNPRHQLGPAAHDWLTRAAGGYHIDFASSGSEEDIELYLKHYADDAARKWWQAEWPDEDIPQHVDPPYDRDRQLPQSYLETSYS